MNQDTLVKMAQESLDDAMEMMDNFPSKEMIGYHLILAKHGR